MSEIKSSEISVVVQGAVDKELTPKCLLSIRKYLPEAEIILSTWEGTDVSGLSYDKVLLNKDPGAFPYLRNSLKSNNLNRYLVSSRNGIQKASKKYILKIRSDIVLTGCNFLNWFDEFPRRDKRYSLFEHKVLTSSLYTLEGELDLKEGKGKIHSTPYHISDWWHFGFGSDIRLLYSCSIIKDFQNFAQYFTNPNYGIKWMNDRLLRFPSEQYLGVELAKKKFPDLDFPDCLSYQNVDMEQSRNFVIDNFIMLDYKQSGLLLEKCPYKRMQQKFWKISPVVFYTMFSFERYKELYYGRRSISLLFKRFWYFIVKFRELKK